MVDILDEMKKKCVAAGYYPTANIEKIARAKNMMFGGGEWYRCPCDGSNEKRFCISPLCQSDIERDGICHCRCYQKAKPEA